MMEDALRDIKAKQKIERAFPLVIRPAEGRTPKE
jgi:hypothetical protein